MSEPPAPPEDPAAALRRAARLMEAGDAAAAAALYRELATAHPEQAGLWAMLGDALRVSGDTAGGAAALAKAAGLAPEDTDIAVEWALALVESGDAAGALGALAGRELALAESARGQAVLALAYRKAGRPVDAVTRYRRLLALEPDDSDARILLGVCLQESGDLNGAIGQYTAALAQDPASVDALTNLGLAWETQGDLDAAHAALTKAGAMEPNDPTTQCALGSVLQKRGDAEAAAACFERAVAAAPEDANAWSNLGNARQDQLRLDEALAAHDRAVALAPDDPEVRWNRAVTLLSAGDFATGFAEYEWRAKTAKHAPPTHESPLWDGRDPTGTRLLMLAEQGFGDAIQFVRYAPALQRRGAQIVIQCHPKLAPLFETLESAPTVVATGSPLPPVDAHIPLMSLPHLLEAAPESVPADIPYLRPPAETRTPPPADGRPRVGLCWTGNPDHPDNAHRSVPFSQLAPLLSRADIDWRSLQFGRGSHDARGRLPEDAAWTACLAGFGNTAAAVASCDLVISVDTATAHLAGALGRPVWLLLKFAPDWRWMVGRDDSPWYPTARLFRQAAPGDWSGPLVRLESALESWLECRC